MRNSSTIAKGKTFDFQEKSLFSSGYTREIHNMNASRYKCNDKYAFIIYVGNGEGFKTIFYDIITES